MTNFALGAATKTVVVLGGSYGGNLFLVTYRGKQTQHPELICFSRPHRLHLSAFAIMCTLMLINVFASFPLNSR